METAKIYPYFPAKIRKELEHFRKTGGTTIARQYLHDYQTLHDLLASWNHHTEGAHQSDLDALLNGIVRNKLLTHNVLSIKTLHVSPYDDTLIKEMVSEYTAILERTGINSYTFGSDLVSPKGNTPEIFVFCSILDDIETLPHEQQSQMLEMLKSSYTTVVSILHTFQQQLNDYVRKWSNRSVEGHTMRTRTIIDGCAVVIQATVYSIKTMKDAAQAHFVV